MIITGGGGQTEFIDPKAREPLATKEKHFTLIDLPTGKAQELQVVISALNRHNKPLFKTSFYQWEPNGPLGEPSMQLRPYIALENDPTLPQYLVELYKKHIREISLRSGKK